MVPSPATWRHVVPTVASTVSEPFHTCKCNPHISTPAGLLPLVRLLWSSQCKTFLHYVTTCPAWLYDICHEDLGGTERLRAPCPAHLVCFYCLKINPLHCNIGGPEPAGIAAAKGDSMNGGSNTGFNDMAPAR